MNKFKKTANILIAGICILSFNLNIFAKESLNYLSKQRTLIDKNLIETDTNLPTKQTKEYTLEYFGNQLDKANAENQRAVYNAIKNIKPADKQIIIDLVNPIKYFSLSKEPEEYEYENAAKDINDITQSSVNAVLKDYPSLFWLKFNIEGEANDDPTEVCNFSYSQQATFNSNLNKYEWEISQLKFNAFSNFDNTVSRQTDLNKAIKNFKISGDTRYDKLKSIHDSLANKITYDRNETVKPDSFEATGALLDGLAVCEGYSKAFKLLCDRENIPCVLVRGRSNFNSSDNENHMWNYVQMEDNNWYAIDLTWDDQETSIQYDYFLSGSDTIATNFGGDSFLSSHVEMGNFSSNAAISFKYPAISRVAYVNK